MCRRYRRTRPGCIRLRPARGANAASASATHGIGWHRPEAQLLPVGLRRGGAAFAPNLLGVVSIKKRFAACVPNVRFHVGQRIVAAIVAAILRGPARAVRPAHPASSARDRSVFAFSRAVSAAQLDGDRP